MHKIGDKYGTIYNAWSKNVVTHSEWLYFICCRELVENPLMILLKMMVPVHQNGLGVVVAELEVPLIENVAIDVVQDAAVDVVQDEAEVEVQYVDEDEVEENIMWLLLLILC